VASSPMRPQARDDHASALGHAPWLARPNIHTSGLHSSASESSSPPSAFSSISSSWTDTPLTTPLAGSHPHHFPVHGQGPTLSNGQDWNSIFSGPLDDVTFSALDASGMLGPSNSMHSNMSGMIPARFPQGAHSANSWDGSANMRSHFPPHPHHQQRPSHLSTSPTAPGPQRQNTRKTPTQGWYSNPFDSNSVPSGHIVPPPEVIASTLGGSGSGGFNGHDNPSLGWNGPHGMHDPANYGHGHGSSAGPYRGGSGDTGFGSPTDDPVPTFPNFLDDTLFPNSPVTDGFANEDTGIGAPRVRDLTNRMTALQLKKQQEERAAAAEASLLKKEDEGVEDSLASIASAGGRGRALNKGKGKVTIVGFDDGEPEEET
jgi:hypothetical protein